MIEVLPPHLLRAALGLLLGLCLGFVARRGRFCTLGAIEDAVYAEDTARLRAWLLAAAVAILGAHLLEAGAGLDLTRSVYAGPRLEWGGAIVGGLMFGFGMALVGTCGFGTLLRLGGGDLKALVTFLVIAISAVMAMRGLTGLGRVALLDPIVVDVAGSQRIGALLSLEGGARTVFGVVVALALGGLALSGASLRGSPALVATGAAIGALVVAGWWATGIAGDDAFDPARVESFSFVRPLGEAVLWAMLASGVRVDFAVASVVGVAAGACLAALSAGQFRWEAPDDARELRRHLAGAFLMGTGGVAALGCTIGQGVTGLSTLSLGSVLAILAIAAGARLGLYVLVERIAFAR